MEGAPLGAPNLASALKLSDFLHHLIGSGDDLPRSAISTLGGDHLRELLSQIHVRSLERVGSDRPSIDAGLADRNTTGFYTELIGIAIQSAHTVWVLNCGKRQLIHAADHAVIEDGAHHTFRRYFYRSY